MKNKKRTTETIATLMICTVIALMLFTSTSSAGSTGLRTDGIVTDASGNRYDLYNYQYTSGWGQGVYATASGYPQRVQSTLDTIGKLNTPQDITNYINNYVGKRQTKITADMVVKASQKYDASWEIIIAIIQRETQLGTDGSKGSRGYNWGNVGNTDTLMANGGSKSYPTPQSGVDAVAKNLAHRKVSTSAAPAAPAAPVLIRVMGTTQVYHIDTNGHKAWIPTAKVFNSWGWDWNSITDVTQTQFNAYPDASPSKVVFKDGTFIKYGNDIAIIKNGQKCQFTNWQAYVNQHGSSDLNGVVPVDAFEWSLNGRGADITN